MSDPSGRLIAAERNSLAAINFCKQLRAAMNAMEEENKQLRAELAQTQQTIGALNVRLAGMVGTGATTRG